MEPLSREVRLRPEYFQKDGITPVKVLVDKWDDQIARTLRVLATSTPGPNRPNAPNAPNPKVKSNWDRMTLSNRGMTQDRTEGALTAATQGASQARTQGAGRVQGLPHARTPGAGTNRVQGPPHARTPGAGVGRILGPPQSRTQGAGRLSGSRPQKRTMENSDQSSSGHSYQSSELGRGGMLQSKRRRSNSPPPAATATGSSLLGLPSNVTSAMSAFQSQLSQGSQSAITPDMTAAALLAATLALNQAGGQGNLQAMMSSMLQGQLRQQQGKQEEDRLRREREQEELRRENMERRLREERERKVREEAMQRERERKREMERMQRERHEREQRERLEQERITAARRQLDEARQRTAMLAAERLRQEREQEREKERQLLQAQREAQRALEEQKALQQARLAAVNQQFLQAKRDAEEQARRQLLTAKHKNGQQTKGHSSVPPVLARINNKIRSNRFAKKDASQPSMLTKIVAPTSKTWRATKEDPTPKRIPYKDRWQSPVVLFSFYSNAAGVEKPLCGVIGTERELTDQRAKLNLQSQRMIAFIKENDPVPQLNLLKLRLRSADMRMTDFETKVAGYNNDFMLLQNRYKKILEEASMKKIRVEKVLGRGFLPKSVGGSVVEIAEKKTQPAERSETKSRSRTPPNSKEKEETETKATDDSRLKIKKEPPSATKEVRRQRKRPNRPREEEKERSAGTLQETPRPRWDNTDESEEELLWDEPVDPLIADDDIKSTVSRAESEALQAAAVEPEALQTNAAEPENPAAQADEIEVAESEVQLSAAGDATRPVADSEAEPTETVPIDDDENVSNEMEAEPIPNETGNPIEGSEPAALLDVGADDDNADDAVEGMSEGKAVDGGAIEMIGKKETVCEGRMEDGGQEEVAETVPEVTKETSLSPAAGPGTGELQQSAQKEKKPTTPKKSPGRTTRAKTTPPAPVRRTTRARARLSEKEETFVTVDEVCTDKAEQPDDAEGTETTEPEPKATSEDAIGDINSGDYVTIDET